ncbi:hypothetical protein CEXT_801491 [Caerostris extrusa]|uniref:Uncharacterized protein n=1 Tax=Caerostris extrusa TaxID=172846 RepID=A0AAV4UZB1_CAEEX|nr:hypothetical protein CEXT_801491 [Caerostris extrusa]
MECISKGMMFRIGRCAHVIIQIYVYSVISIYDSVLIQNKINTSFSHDAYSTFTFKISCLCSFACKDWEDSLPKKIESERNMECEMNSLAEISLSGAECSFQS